MKKKKFVGGRMNMIVALKPRKNLSKQKKDGKIKGNVEI